VPGPDPQGSCYHPATLIYMSSDVVGAVVHAGVGSSVDAPAEARQS
jgi:hypothetical protein